MVAINNPWNLTNGPAGTKTPVPHPSIHIGGFKITWGQDNLPYWYLLLVMLIIVIVLFYRLENSRLGRAWAAIREDEVAAQASGVNTVRAKLLAFAIGASTSGARRRRSSPARSASSTRSLFSVFDVDPDRRLRRLRRDGLAGRRDGRVRRCSPGCRSSSRIRCPRTTGRCGWARSSSP